MPIKVITAPDATELEKKYDKFCESGIKHYREVFDVQFQMVVVGKPYYALLVRYKEIDLSHDH